MGAFAVVSLPLDLSRGSGASIVATAIVETFPGTRAVTLDAAGTVSFELQFPGNLSELVNRLSANGIAVGERGTVSVPVANLAPSILGDDPGLFARRMDEGPEVWDAQFARGRYISDTRLNGDRVEATIVPGSAAMHELYDALLTLGLVVHGAAEPSSPGV